MSDQTIGSLVEDLIVLRDKLKSNADRDLIAVVAAHLSSVARLRKALTPLADLGVTEGPDNEPDPFPYRLLRGSIRNARAALSSTEAQP